MSLRTNLAPALLAVAAFLFPERLLAAESTQPLETLPGFKPHGVYEGKGIENLSLFNGDPQLAVPIGPEYPIGPGSTFQLTAHYSTRFWHMYEVTCGPADACGQQRTGRAHVRGLPTLGVGWTLELGSIDPSPPGSENVAARYMSPDGGIHEFNDPAPGSSTFPYDDIEIRIEKLASGGYVIRHPDGTSHWLTHPYTRPPSRNNRDFSDVDYNAVYPRTARWGLGEIRDSFGTTVLTVEWETPAAKDWMVKTIWLPGPSRGIHFHWDSYGAWDVLTSISFPILESPSPPLSAVFAYSNDGTFQRTGFDGGIVSGCPEAATSSIDLPFLESITQDANVHTFDYSLGPTGTGLLSGFTLPTGTQVTYLYSSATAPTPCLMGVGCSSLDETTAPPPIPNDYEQPSCDFWTRGQLYIDRVPAVRSRTETDLTTNLSATTEYDRKQFAEWHEEEVGDDFVRIRDPDRVLRRVIVKRPSGNPGEILATRHLFHVLVESDQGSSGPGVEVERRYYAGSLAAGTPVRAVVQCYDNVTPFQTPVTACGAFAADGTIASFPLGFGRARSSREVTWYGAYLDSGSECSAATATQVACQVLSRTEWDPVAREFAKATTSAPSEGPSSILLQGGQSERRTTTVWAPSSGADYWQPKLYTSRTVEDVYSGDCPFGPCAVTTITSFNQVTGALNSSSVSDSGLSRTTAWGYTSGNPTSETVAGAGLSGTYTTTRAFQAGTGLVTSSQRTAPAGIGWKQFDVTRDSALGLVTSSRDPNVALVTTYAWDPLARLTSIVPPGGEAQTRICYGARSGSQGAWALIKRGISSSCSTSAAEPAEGSETAEAFVYDGLGRVAREIRLLPSETAVGTYLAVRTTERNAAGLVSAVSEWLPCGSGTDFATCFQAPFPTSNRTIFSSFDVFGRPRSIVLPDSTQILKGYDDWAWATDGPYVPSTDTRVGTWTKKGDQPGTYEAMRRDIFGRTIAIAEPVFADEPPLPPEAPQSLGEFTFYRYDLHSQVAEVRQDRPISSSSHYEQVRRFTRNALGFLTAETQPETGLTEYGSFTAMGWPGTTQTGGVTLNRTYDAIGRVTKISSGQDYLWNRFDGDEGGVRTDAYLGKLTKRIGYNPGSFENARVEEVFTYGGRGGRLSSRQTNLLRGTAGNPTVASLSQLFTWNLLGLPETKTLSGPGSSLSTQTYYTSGTPTRILSGTQALISSATYHPHGGLKSYTTGNGVQTTIGADPHGLPRPSRVHTTGATANFDTGAFTYDGAGNVTRMQPSVGSPDVFTYDRLSRLKTATWGTISSTHSESFSYDGEEENGFGSLTAITTQGAGMPPSVSLAADPVTNRLVQGQYDGRGNLLAFPTGASVPEMAFTYDALSRRTSDERLGTHVSWHLYDAENERVARVLPGTQVTTNALSFFTVTPCRVLDTRGAAGPYGSPYLTGGQSRAFTLPGQCGVAADAVSLVGNLTSVPRADAGGVSGTHTAGFLKLYPADTAPTAAAAAVVNPAKTRSQFAFGKLAGTGAFRLLADIPSTETVDVILDISGYFAPLPGSAGPRTWLLTQRDSENHPVAEWKWQEGSSAAAAQSFHVYLGATKVATRELTPSAAWTFYSSDHLGTPRLKTGERPQGQSLAPALESYRYRAFGERFEALGQPERAGREFAMMERDAILPPGSTASSGTDNHYVHARFFADKFARFLSPDQVSGSPEDPQSWNRYTYARNNPLKYVDPDGREEMDAVLMSTQRMQLRDMGGEGAVQRFDRTNLAMGGAALAGLAGGALLAPAEAALGGSILPGVTAEVFRQGAGPRGRVIETVLGSIFGGTSLHPNFPVIDRFLNGVATSVKSLDLAASSYASRNALFNAMARYVDKLDSFSGRTFAGKAVGDADSPILKKVLEVAMQKGIASPHQIEQLRRAQNYAASKSIELKVFWVAK